MIPGGVSNNTCLPNKFSYGSLAVGAGLAIGSVGSGGTLAVVLGLGAAVFGAVGLMISTPGCGKESGSVPEADGAASGDAEPAADGGTAEPETFPEVKTSYPKGSTPKEIKAEGIDPDSGITTVPEVRDGGTEVNDAGEIVPVDGGIVNKKALVIAFSATEFMLEYSGNGAVVQPALTPIEFTIRNTQGKMDCSENVSYYIVFRTNNALVKDKSEKTIGKSFPDICPNGAINITRNSDLVDGGSDDFVYPPDATDDFGKPLYRPPLAFTHLEVVDNLNGANVAPYDPYCSKEDGGCSYENAFAVPMGDVNKNCKDDLASVPTKIKISRKVYCPSGDINATFSNGQVMIDTTYAPTDPNQPSLHRAYIQLLNVLEVKE